jgi:prepilin-type N-terminal cleavage/methylation domain-containing protein
MRWQKVGGSGNRGFTLPEVLILILILGFVVLVICGNFLGGYIGNILFYLSDSKDIKTIVDPKTGEAEECIRMVDSSWKCRPMKVRRISAESE